jgi:predicted nucleic acid-binding protein
MISFDTNLPLYSLNRDCAEYNGARALLASLPTAPGTVSICELAGIMA